MWPYPKVIAHRGGGACAPENTLAALRCGLAHGFHAAEFDVMLSKDNVPVVMHDPILGRTVAGMGNIADFTAAELASMDAGIWFSPAFAEEQIPTFERFVRFCQRNHIWMNIEIKPSPGQEQQTGSIVAQLARHLLDAEITLHIPGVDDESLPLFSSFSFDALLAAKAAAPEIPRGYLVDTIPGDWLQRLHQLDAVALHTNQKNLSREQAQAVKDAGFGLFCYTVNDPARAAELFSWGVDAFCTDRIDLIGANFSS